MKHKIRLGRAAALVLSGALCLGVLWPNLATQVSGWTIDQSGWTNPAVRQMTIYDWKKDLPSVSSNNLGKKYGVLLTWDDKYYFRVTPSLADYAEKNMGNFVGMNYHLWTEDKKYNGLINGSYDAKNGYPHMACRKDVGYGASLMSELEELDFDLLKAGGTITTVELPDGIPCIIPLLEADKDLEYFARDEVKRAGSKELYNSPIYGLYVNLQDSYWAPQTSAFSYYRDGGFRTGDNYIIGVRRDNYVHRVEDGKHYYTNGFNWTIYGFNSCSEEIMERDMRGGFLFAERYNDETLYHHYFDRDNPKALQNLIRYPVPKFHCGWYVKEITVSGKRKYAFFTPGVDVRTPDSDNEYSDFYDWEQLADFIEDHAWISLSHWDGNFETRGLWKPKVVEDIINANANTKYNWSKNYGQYDLKAGSYVFDCYYGEPFEMAFLQTDFSVQNGQVTNLDKATAIGSNCTITVKNGGTLTVDGWLLNNGTIKVEEGGTLYVQDNACVNRYNGKSVPSGGGAIISNGVIIVGENAKLIGGGATGIQLLEGSHLVNYGCVASENFKISLDHTLENRNQGFVLYGEGNGVLRAGSTTNRTPLDYKNKTFAEKGKVEQVCTVDIAENAIYQN